MKFMKRAFGEFHKFHMKWPRVLSYDSLKWYFMAFTVNIISIRNALLTRMFWMTLPLRAKVLLHMWSYDFYDMTLSTE